MTAKRWFVSVPSLAVLILAGWLAYVAAQSAWVVMAFQFVLVGVGATILLGAAGGLVFAGLWGWHRWERWRIDIKTAQGKSVQFFGSDGMVYAANPGGVPIQALHLDTRSYIPPVADVADDFNALKWAAFNSRRQKVISPQPEPPALLPAGLSPVLPVIIGSQRLLIAGGMGSGKTNLLRWIAAEKAKASKVLVIDTHAAPGLWPIDPAAVLGRGRNWAGVETALQNLLAIMDKRYKDIDAGSVGYRGHEIITVIADEWTMIPQMIGADTIKNYSKPVLVESRKVGIDFVLATHDTTVEALGTKGMSGLKTAFDYIVETQQRDGQYICRVRKPGQKVAEAVEYAAPPLFAPVVVEPDWIVALREAPPPAYVEADEGELADGPTDEEQAIMVAYYGVRDENGGKVVLKQVCEKLGWNPGGMQYAKIKAAMKKWTDEDL